ncbi:MAG: hypothetical protein ACJ8AS_05415 [Hyphomicrobiales bacterium]
MARLVFALFILATIAPPEDAIGAFTEAGLEVTRASFDGSTLVFFVGYANFQGAGFYTTQVVLP